MLSVKFCQGIELSVEKVTGQPAVGLEVYIWKYEAKEVVDEIGKKDRDRDRASGERESRRLRSWP